LAKRLRLPHVYAGDLYRREAERRGLSLEQLNELSAEDHSIDRNLDAAMARRAREGDVILEGRLAAFIAAQEGVDALKAWLTAGDAVRARRVAQREGGDAAGFQLRNRLRHDSDTRRYREIYGFDLRDTSVYDVVMHTDDQTPEALADRLAALARRRFAREESA